MIRLRPGCVFFVQCEGGTPKEEMPGVIQARKLVKAMGRAISDLLGGPFDLVSLLSIP